MSGWYRTSIWMFLFACVCAMCPGSASSRQDSSQEIRHTFNTVFQEGNASYEAGDYAAAIEAYRRLADAGVADGDLYYNLGNAHYRNNELGEAVLFYQRSLRIQPRNGDAKENLELVRSQLRDKQFVRSENRLLRGVLWPHNNLSVQEMTVFVSISYLLLCILSIILIFGDSPPVVAAYRKVSLVSLGRLIGLSLRQDVLVAMAVAFVLLVTSGASLYSKRAANRSEAVVLGEEVGVFSSPTEDATLQFKIHEGTMVNVRDRRDAWAKITLPGGMSGWVNAESVQSL